MCLGDTSPGYSQSKMMLAVSLGTLKSEISAIYLFFEAPESDESEEAGQEVEAEGDAEDTDVATGVVKPGAQGERHRVGEVPDYPQHRQHDHPLPGPGVVRDEAVGDQDEGAVPTQALYRDVEGEPEPLREVNYFRLHF